MKVKRLDSVVSQGRVVRKANGSGSREVAAGGDKKIERTQDIHQLYSASQTFQIFEPLNIDILSYVPVLEELQPTKTNAS